VTPKYSKMINQSKNKKTQLLLRAVGVIWVSIQPVQGTS
jgi:hypothetical protein